MVVRWDCHLIFKKLFPGGVYSVPVFTGLRDRRKDFVACRITASTHKADKSEKRKMKRGLTSAVSAFSIFPKVQFHCVLLSATHQAGAATLRGCSPLRLLSVPAAMRRHTGLPAQNQMRPRLAHRYGVLRPQILHRQILHQIHNPSACSLPGRSPADQREGITLLRQGRHRCRRTARTECP